MFSQINSQDTVFDISKETDHPCASPALHVEAMQFLAQLSFQYLKRPCLSLPLPLVSGGPLTVKPFLQLDTLCSLSIFHNSSFFFDGVHVLSSTIFTLASPKAQSFYWAHHHHHHLLFFVLLTSPFLWSMTSCEHLMGISSSTALPNWIYFKATSAGHSLPIDGLSILLISQSQVTDLITCPTPYAHIYSVH